MGGLDSSPVGQELAWIGGHYGYGEVWGRPGLELRIRSFLTIAILQVMHENDQLHFHVNNALNLGISPEELQEALVQAGVYGGTSGWNNASNVAREVFRQRGLPN
jgi:4-carboxymuconolactone decarboxylase